MNLIISVFLFFIRLQKTMFENERRAGDVIVFDVCTDGTNGLYSGGREVIWIGILIPA